MAATAYLETTIISYLAAWPSRDLVTAARQQVTHEWWARRRPAFAAYVSELVVAEASGGNPEAAERRAVLLAGLPVLDIVPRATVLAGDLARELRLPERARADALHIAIAAVHGIDYLLTWNATHLANAELRPRVERFCRFRGLSPQSFARPMSSWENDCMFGEVATQRPWHDSIAAEVRAAREDLLASCDFDLEKLATELRERQRVEGREVVTLAPRSPEMLRHMDAPSA